MSITYQAENHLFHIPKNKVNASTYLSSMAELGLASGFKEPFKLNVSSKDMKVMYDLLVNDKIPNYDAVPILDYFDIDCSSSYNLSLLHGTYYTKYYQELKLNPFFGLQCITKDYWNSFKVKPLDDDHLLFNDINLKPLSWETIRSNLSKLNNILTFIKSKAIIVGESIFKSMFDCKSYPRYGDIFERKSNQIDICLYDFNDQEVVEDIARLSLSKDVEVKRKNSANVITLEMDIEDVVTTYHIILIKKILPAQILHILDIVCTALCYDGNNIWMSNRALYAIKHGINTVNLKMASNLYPHRLCQYGLMGMSITIPNYQSQMNSVYMKCNLIVNHIEDNPLFIIDGNQVCCYINDNKLFSYDDMDILLCIYRATNDFSHDKIGSILSNIGFDYDVLHEKLLNVFPASMNEIDYGNSLDIDTAIWNMRKLEFEHKGHSIFYGSGVSHNPKTNSPELKNKENDTNHSKKYTLDSILKFCNELQ